MKVPDIFAIYLTCDHKVTHKFVKVYSDTK